MKNIKDLTENDVIHCPTKKEWKEVLKLNEKNNVSAVDWNCYKENTCYSPTHRDGKGGYCSVSYYTNQNKTIHKASDFLVEFKQGDDVLVGDGPGGRRLEKFLMMNPVESRSKYVTYSDEDGEVLSWEFCKLAEPSKTETELQIDKLQKELDELKKMV